MSASQGRRCGPDAADAAVRGELEDHRVGHPHRPQPRLADGHAVLTLADHPRPAQIAQRAVDGAEQMPDVVAPAKDHPPGDRRDKLDVIGEGLHHPVDVIRFGGGEIARERLVHEANDIGITRRSRTTKIRFSIAGTAIDSNDLALPPLSAI